MKFGEKDENGSLNDVSKDNRETVNHQPRRKLVATVRRIFNVKGYFFFFCALSVLQGAYYTYFHNILPTLEKRFSFDKKLSRTILLFDNLGPILLAIPIGYFLGNKSKPRWIATGILLNVLGSLGSMIPYFIYGNIRHESNLLMDSLSTSRHFHGTYCNDTITPKTDCESVRNISSNTVAAVIFIVANFLNGIGCCAFYTLGISYLDDNVKKSHSPVYFGAFFSVRIFGPILGFVISSFCLKIYENPFYTPEVNMVKEHWIGAWWIGFLVFGFLMAIFAIPVFYFTDPLHETGEYRKHKLNIQRQITLNNKAKAFCNSIRRILGNPLLMYHVISISLRVNGIMGYYMSLSTYMESQFRQTTSRASIYAGYITAITMIISFLTGGLLMKKYKPKAGFITGFMVAAEFGTLLVFFAVTFMRCPSLKLASETNSCSQDCNCSPKLTNPICFGNCMYLSPCHAGCPRPINNSLQLSDCQCLHGENTGKGWTSKIGLGSSCLATCWTVLPYIIVLNVGKIISAMPRVGNAIFTLRCVEPSDKSLALGVIGAFIALFGFIPHSLIYDYLFDSSCLIWEPTCDGRKGTCIFYDADHLRVSLHSVTIGFIALGVVFEFFVYLLSGRATDMFGRQDISLDSTELTVLNPIARDTTKLDHGIQ